MSVNLELREKDAERYANDLLIEGHYLTGTTACHLLSARLTCNTTLATSTFQPLHIAEFSKSLQVICSGCVNSKETLSVFKMRNLNTDPNVFNGDEYFMPCLF